MTAVEQSRWKPYPAYKDSGVEWFSKLPEHWEVGKSGHFFKERNTLSSTGRETLLSVSEYFGVAPRREIVDAGEPLTRADSLNGYKKCKPGDLVINIMLAWKRGLGITAQPGIVSPSYKIYQPNIDFISPPYINYLFCTPLYGSIFEHFSYGIIKSRLRLYSRSFYQTPLPLPPLPEQKAIATFLDRKTSQIDDLIEKKERLIDLLQEKRQALITHTVTKGLDPDAPMKDSGIEWLGEIPEGWETKYLKYAAQFVYGDSLRSEEQQAGAIPVYGSNGVVGAHVRPNTIGPTIIIGRKGSYGKVNYSSNSCFAIDTTFFVDSRYTNDDLKWLFYLLKTLPLDAFSQDSAVPGLSREYAYSFRVPSLPLPEQKAIADYLDEKTSQIDQLIDKTKQAIEYLKEYRTALITAAATGQIDVRDEVDLSECEMETSENTEQLKEAKYECH